jgi:glycerophosphodiester phosphodiesterase
MTYEIDDVTATLVEISSLVSSVGEYISVTQRALERITSKIGRTLQETEKLGEILETATTQWMDCLRSINRLLQCLHQQRSSVDGNTSLLLSNIHPMGVPSVLQEAREALQHNSVSRLEKCLQDGIFCSSNPGSQAALLVLTKLCILCSSTRCIAPIVSRMQMADSNQNSALNLLCAYLVLAGRQVEAKTLCFEDILEVFRKLLENIQPLNRWRALLHKDTLGRSVLHYAARYGMTQVCSEIYEQTLRSLGHNSIPDLYVSNIIAEDGWGDTPLSIAVNYGHEEVVKLFLQNLSTSDGHSLLMNGGVTLRHTSHRMIDFAIRSKQSRIAELLIDAFARQLDRRTETQDLLYLASQLGMVSIIQRLVDYIDNIDAGDRLQGRTPLIAASINNHPKAVETLLSVPSCNIRVQDYSGWTAVDHAAFRGRAALVKALLNHEKDPYFRHELKGEGSNLAAELPDVKSINDGSKKMAVVPEICHRTELESHIFVNLGSFDLEKDFKILDMDPFRQLLAPMKVPDCSLKLQISGIDCVPVGDTAVRFPILEDLSNDPFHFTSTTIDAAKLLFEVYCSVVGEDCHPSQQKPVGSGIVLLNELRRGLGTSRENLVRDHTIPLASMNENGSTYIGSVTFTFVIARPFQHDSPMPTPSELPLNRKDSTLIMGHRGEQVGIADLLFTD